MPSRYLQGESLGGMDTILTAVAPARVNIIGEHTDYNDGFVLPTCTALFTRVSARRREDREVHVRSSKMDDERVFDVGDIQPDNGGDWIEYVKGVAAGLRDAGVELAGADLWIDSNIPLGAGLSSSASLELAVAEALLGMTVSTMDAHDLALLCQKAEHEYAGVQCGIMDQYALACAQFGNALMLDCRSMQTRQVSIPSDLAFFLTDSGVRHSLVDGEYNKRADECATAVAVISKSNPGVCSLRDVNDEILAANEEALGDVLFRRCRHVVSENKRVQDMVAALDGGDLGRVGVLLNACHDSLRDDYDVSCTELDTLVLIANDDDRVLGSRMVGAGFGGCVLSACRKEDAKEVAAKVRSDYAAASGEEPLQHVVESAHPARLEEPA
ncbi:MAG: galactokinase [Woeseiaceae bacterium]